MPQLRSPLGYPNQIDQLIQGIHQFWKNLDKLPDANIFEILTQIYKALNPHQTAQQVIQFLRKISRWIL